MVNYFYTSGYLVIQQKQVIAGCEQDSSSNPARGMTGKVPAFRRGMHGAMQLGEERFEDDATRSGPNGRRRPRKSSAIHCPRRAAYCTSLLRHSGARSSREPGIEKPDSAAGFRVCAEEAHPGMTNQNVRVVKAGCDKAAPMACLMLHLRSCYVSKAAILTVPVLLVLVENRSPA
jgi:hypothetical protein